MMYPRLWFICLMWFGLRGSLACGQDEPSSVGEPSRYYFRQVLVFDGERAIGAQDVQVDDGMITAVGQHLTPSEGSVVIDGTGHTLVPGLIDCHTHTYWEAHLQQAAFFGVTTECDMMSMPRAVARFREQRESKAKLPHAELFSAGFAVTVAKGHGTQFGFPVPTLSQASEAEEFVRARIEEGSDYIKIIYDDGAALGITFQTLDREMLEGTIQAAHAQNRLAVAHVGSRAGARDAIELGIDGLVHLFADEVIDQDLLDLALQRKIFVVPTAVVIANACNANQSERILSDNAFRSLLSEADVEALKRTFPVRSTNRSTWDVLSKNIMLIQQAGIPVLAGTDAPNPGTAHGASLHLEMELLVGSGLSNQAALAAATGKAAQAFGWKDRGRIAEGFIADLLLIQGNPLQDIVETRKIAAVWKRGLKIERAERIKSLEKRRQKSAQE